MGLMLPLLPGRIGSARRPGPARIATRPSRTARPPWVIPPRSIASARPTPPDRHLSSDSVREAQPLQHAAVARRFLRRNLKRHGFQPPAGARPEGKRAGALSESAEARALRVEHLD